MTRTSFRVLLEAYKSLDKRTKSAIKQKFNQIFGFPPESNVFHEKMRVPSSFVMYEYDFLSEEILRNKEFENWLAGDLKKEPRKHREFA